VQGGVGWGTVVPRQDDRFHRANSLSIPKQRDFEQTELEDIAKLFEGVPGFEFMSDTGDAVKIVGKDNAAYDAITKKAVEVGSNEMYGGVLNTRRMQGGEHVGGYADYADAWSKPPGSGAATRQLEGALSERDILALDNNPRIRQIMRDKNIHDKAYAEELGLPLRQDVITAREIIASSGFAGLFEALKKGSVALPAVALTSTAALNQYLGLDDQQ
jgi:hypothetical protein